MDGLDTMMMCSVSTHLNSQPRDQRRPDDADDKKELNIRWICVWLPHLWVLDSHGYEENSAYDRQGRNEIANPSFMPIAARRSVEVSQPCNGAHCQRKADNHGKLEYPRHMHDLL